VSSAEDQALVELGRMLRASGYRFVTPTPATHQRVNARPSNREARSLTDVLGWSRPFRSGVVPAEIEKLLAAAGALERVGDRSRSTVRFSTVDPADESDSPAIHVHSAFPTTGADAVFFGPDTYRFIQLLRRSVGPARRLVDIGAGSGAGGLALRERMQQVVLADINHAALRHARINATLAGARAGDVEVVESDVLAGVTGPIDVVIANPPYLADPGRRLYRDGGGALGFDLSVRIVHEALARLGSGGQLVLYTGSPVVAGQHPLRASLAPLLAARPCRSSWEEIDPDVFGEELDAPAYQDVERIAVVALVVHVA
jgi:methylase of polypeptide subunit release factors